MTIRPGEPWGVAVDTDPNARVARSDAELGELSRDAQQGPLRVRGGDVFRSLGEPRDRPTVNRVPFDCIEVVLDGEVHYAVAHVVLRRWWWRGPLVLIANVSQLGRWNAAPRAHPNDGLVDIVEVEPQMSLRDRWKARQRAVTASHLPHPALSYTRVSNREWTFDRPMRCVIDGREVERARTVSVFVIPDAFELDV